MLSSDGRSVLQIHPANWRGGNFASVNEMDAVRGKKGMSDAATKSDITYTSYFLKSAENLREM